MHLRYYLLLIFTSLLWGANFVGGKFLVGHASPTVLTEYRWVLAIICLLPFVLWKEKTILFPKQAFWPLLLMGMTGAFLFNVLQFLALQYTSADNVGLLSTLNPISIAIASFFLLHEKVSPRQIVAMILSFIGILIVISHGNLKELAMLHFNIGDIFMICAVAIWGIYSIAAKIAMKYVSPYQSTLWAAIFGTAMIFPFTRFSFHVTNPNTSFWIALFYTGIGATVLAMVFWNIGVQKVGSTKSGMFLNFNPIFTAIFAYFLIGEKINLLQFLGGIIVILGVYLFTTKNILHKKANHLS